MQLKTLRVHNMHIALEVLDNNKISVYIWCGERNDDMFTETNKLTNWWIACYPITTRKLNVSFPEDIPSYNRIEECLYDEFDNLNESDIKCHSALLLFEILKKNLPGCDYDFLA